ncbi:MAG TPA: cellulase family glycosylhydrolase [Flavobacterium lutivivi]|nr:cellulase family glycosylhydrolase [Flavobacterium lutivivi]
MDSCSFHYLNLKWSRLLLFFLIATSTSFAQGFLHQEGQKIVNGNGQNVLLRGLGLGGWMVQEGYMLKTADFAGTQFKIKQEIIDLIGEEKTEEFYQKYLENGITKQDIDSLAKWGFNSVRLPMHYNLYTLPIEKENVSSENTWLEKGFVMTDNLLKWCAENKMYLILDLHAAPGGQGKDANISDYDETKPSLWESETNKKKMIAFWKKIANRYKDNQWIGAYDIINEPNWNFTGTNKNGCDEKLNQPLRELQVEITKAIREVDANHMIIIEGNCWGNNYDGIFPLWDSNMALSFHKYWNNNDVNSIQKMLDYRTTYNVPIWLGESGENSNVWFTEAISLMEKNNIGWAFWPMKKIDNIAGITSVSITDDYKKLLEYWTTRKNKPSKEFVYKTLMQIAENYKMDNLTIKKDVLDSMFRQVVSEVSIPFTKNNVPGKIKSVDYDMGKLNNAYFDTDYQNLWVSNGTETDWNSGNVYRNDGVDIVKINSDFVVSNIKAGEWIQYTLHSNDERKFYVSIKYNGKQNGEVYLTNSDGTILTEKATLPSTPSKTISIGTIKLKKGNNTIRIVFEKGDFDFYSLIFK